MIILIFRKSKSESGSRYYLFGWCVYEYKRKDFYRYYSVFGLQIFRKSLKSRKLVQAEYQLQHLAERYRHLPNDERLYLCFDCLEDSNVEAIDAWTLFLYLQKENIPSRYFILKDNPLYAQLVAGNKLKDVVAVENDLEVITLHSELVARSKYVFCSFGYTRSDILSRLPCSQYVFIEHGVTLLKKRVASLYISPDLPEARILVPTQLTLDFYRAKDFMSGKRLCCGMPRWDNLSLRTGTIDRVNLFVFFTWRVSCNKSKESESLYLAQIREFVTNLLRCYKNEVHIHFGLHHSLKNLQTGTELPPEVNQVSPTEISTMIRKADLFITDYSSVCFDFMYMDVPTIFYRFDADVTHPDERDNQDADDAAQEDSRLYNVFYDEQAAMDKIDFYVRNGCQLESELRVRNEQIFWTRENNCKNLIELLNEDAYV